MIEDSLKVTRNLERAVLVASLIALVFAYSVRDASRQRELVSSIDQLSQVAPAYDDYLRDLKPDRTIFDCDEKFLSDLRAVQKAHSLNIDSAENLCRKVSAAMDSWEFSAAWLRVRDGKSLAQLDSIINQSFAETNANYLVVDKNGLGSRVVEEIETYALANDLLRDDPFADGYRYTSISDYSISVTNSTGILAITFSRNFNELDTVSFSIPLKLHWEEIPRSSFMFWLTNSKFASLISDSKSDMREWLPGLVSSRERLVPLADLRSSLASEIAAANSANKTIDLPGVRLPGELALVATPLFLLGLLWSLLAHLRHLQVVSVGSSFDIRKFSWPSLNERSRLWLVMASVPSLLLPAWACLLLLYKMNGFSSSSWVDRGISVFATLVVIVLGVTVVRTLAHLRASRNTSDLEE